MRAFVAHTQLQKAGAAGGFSSNSPTAARLLLQATCTLLCFPKTGLCTLSGAHTADVAAEHRTVTVCSTDAQAPRAVAPATVTSKAATQILHNISRSTAPVGSTRAYMHILAVAAQLQMIRQPHSDGNSSTASGFVSPDSTSHVRP
jgi:hypothetical protein